MKMLEYIWIVVTIVSTAEMCKAYDDYQSPRYYVLNLTQTSWYDAQTICRQDNGSLATVYDLSTIPDLALEFVLKNTRGALWIGLHQSINSTWLWDNGDNVTWFNWHPDDVTNDEIIADCVTSNIKNPFYWSRSNCQQRLPFLCQYKGGGCDFVEIKDFSIAANNYMYLYDKTVEHCKTVCETNPSFVCTSFEYHKIGGKCQFNSGNRWMLKNYFSNHTGWDYFHRTCNSGEITGELMDLSPSSSPSSSSSISAATLVTTSSTMSSSSPSIIISPSTTVVSETSNFNIECPEAFITKDVFVTHSVFVSYTTPVTQLIPVTSTRIITQNITQTKTEITTSTVIQFTTSIHIMTSLPVPIFPSASVYIDPVEPELKEIGVIIREKQKTLKRTSVDDKRPSATYVGYVAVAFLSCVFGSIVLFDILTLFRYTQCCKHGITPKKSNEDQGTVINDQTQSIAEIMPHKWDWARFKNRCKQAETKYTTKCFEIKLDDVSVKDPIDSIADTEYSDDMHTDVVANSSEVNPDIGSPLKKRIWRWKHWSVGDSGFDGSDSVSDFGSSPTSNSSSDSLGFTLNEETRPATSNNSDNLGVTMNDETESIPEPSVSDTEYNNTIVKVQIETRDYLSNNDSFN